MNEELIYGINPVLEALRGKRRAFELFVADSRDRRVEKIIAAAEEKNVQIRRRDKKDLTRLAGTEHHQGIVLRVEAFAYADIEDVLKQVEALGVPGLILALDGIQDPHNLGALVRSAACAGAHAVIISKDRAVGVTPVVEKTSAGAVETIPIVRVTNLAQTLDLLKEHGYWAFGAADDAASTLYQQDFTVSTVLVIGAEGDGMRQLVRKKCDQLVAIPLAGGVSSLNASVAGGVLLFEVVRQRLSQGR